MSVIGMAGRLGVSYEITNRILKLYGEEIGEGLFGIRKGSHTNSGVPRPLYSPDQLQCIADKLNLNERPPEGYKGFSIIKGDEPMKLYSPEQQARILQHLQKRYGDVVKPGDEASYASRHAMAKEFGVPKSSIARIIDEYSTIIGEPELVQFGSRITTGYSHAQKETVRALLEDRGKLEYAYPKGFLPVSMILTGIHLPKGVSGSELFKEAVASIPNLGAVVTSANVHNRSFALYSPVQQARIIEYIKARAKVA
jgi:hypothetical protein